MTAAAPAGGVLLPFLLLGLSLGPAFGADAIADGPEAEWPAVVVGTADVRLSADGARASSRLVFAVANEPPVLRAEFVRGGRVVVTLFGDGERLQVVLPGSPSLLHEAPATRASMEAVFGLAVCPEELAFALRLGMAPLPECEGRRAAERRHGDRRIVNLSGGGRAGSVRVVFSRHGRGSDWPSVVHVQAPGGDARVNVSTARSRQDVPLPLDPDVLATAVLVEASEVARALGLAVDQR